MPLTHMPDSGGRFRLVVRPVGSLPELAFEADILACDAPRTECPCEDTTLVLRPAGGEAKGPEARLEFDLATRQLELVSDSGALCDGRIASLQEAMRGEAGDFVIARVRRRKLEHDEYLRADLSLYRRGNLLAMHEVLPREFDLMTREDGVGGAVWVRDLYCMEPTCPCSDVHYEFLAPDGTELATLRVDLKRGTLDSLETAADVQRWNRLVELYGREYLLARYKQMRSVCKRVVKRLRPEQEPVRVDARPSRNDLCPCGSGKKYKKCCAGKEPVLGGRQGVMLGVPAACASGRPR